MSCICQSCSRDYKIDINIPNYLWKKISPSKNETGLLCPICIMERLEDLLEYDVFELIEMKDEKEKIIIINIVDNESLLKFINSEEGRKIIVDIIKQK